MKICIACKEHKPLKSFSKRSNSNDGHRNTCITCENKRKSNHAKNNKVMTKERHERYINRNVLSRKATSAIDSHRRRGFIVNLKSSDIKNMFENTKTCPLCGKKLNYDRNPKDVFSMPSVDRKNNEKILDKTNVWIICRGCNTSKRDMDLETFIKYCKHISNNRGV